jgi:hypothetical protein
LCTVLDTKYNIGKDGRAPSLTLSVLGRRTEKQLLVEPIVIPNGLKIKLLDNFNSTRTKLKAFLIQLELYLRFNISKFGGEIEKVL